MSNKLVHVGFSNFINSEYILGIGSYTGRSAPVVRAVQLARGQSLLIDLTAGKKTKSVIFMDNNMLAISALSPETIESRINWRK